MHTNILCMAEACGMDATVYKYRLQDKQTWSTVQPRKCETSSFMKFGLTTNEIVAFRSPERLLHPLAHTRGGEMVEK